MQLCMATHNFKRKINITDSEPVFLQFRFLLWIYNYIFAVKTLIPKVKVNISIATHLNVWEIRNMSTVSAPRILYQLYL